MHIGMLTDYIAPDCTFGPALAGATFRRNMQMRGHEVTLVGPRPAPWMRKPPPGSIELSAGTFRQYPGVRFTFPWPPASFTQLPPFDIVHSNANTLLMRWAPVVRQLHGVPVLHTNTTYLPEFVHHAIPKGLLQFPGSSGFWNWATKSVENSFARVFNAGDGLIVLCQGLVDYWQRMGLEVPIHVIQRPIDVRIFNRKLGPDPYRGDFKRGARMLCTARHSKEKALDRVVEIFAHHILPANSDASLTLVGDGPAHKALVAQAHALGVSHRVHFQGELPQRDLPDWLGHADLYLYTSLSETFGQVVSEALWMGIPVVGFDDKMGVAHQVKHDFNGLLIDPHARDADGEFAAAAAALLSDNGRRRTLAENAALRQRETSAPEIVYAAYEAAYASAKEHYAVHPPAHVGRPGPVQAMQMTWRYLLPWTWQHATVLASGVIPSGYRPNSKAPLDAAPDQPADEGYAHDGGSSLAHLPQWMGPGASASGGGREDVAAAGQTAAAQTAAAQTAAAQTESSID